MTRQCLRLVLDIEAITPTLVVGDFNLHSMTWSPLDADPSLGAGRFEEWAATNALELLNALGVATRRGTKNQQDCTLDLVWHNFSALRQTFVGAIVDWGFNRL